MSGHYPENEVVTEKGAALELAVANFFERIGWKDWGADFNGVLAHGGRASEVCDDEDGYQLGAIHFRDLHEALLTHVGGFEQFAGRTVTLKNPVPFAHIKDLDVRAGTLLVVVEAGVRSTLAFVEGGVAASRVHYRDIVEMADQLDGENDG